MSDKLSDKVSETSPSKREMRASRTDAILSVESMEGSFIPQESDNRIDFPRSPSKRYSYELIIEPGVGVESEEPQESKVIDWDKYKNRRVNRFRAGRKV